MVHQEGSSVKAMDSEKITSLLDELDHVAQYISSVPRQQTGLSLFQAYWPPQEVTPALAALYPQTDFLTFAVQCQIHRYVQQKLNELTDVGSPPPQGELSRLLYIAVTGRSFLLSPSKAKPIRVQRASSLLISILLEHGADPNWQEYGQSNFPQTTLELASSENQHEIVRLLQKVTEEGPSPRKKMRLE